MPAWKDGHTWKPGETKQLSYPAEERGQSQTKNTLSPTLTPRHSINPLELRSVQGGGRKDRKKKTWNWLNKSSNDWENPEGWSLTRIDEIMFSATGELEFKIEKQSCIFANLRFVLWFRKIAFSNSGFGQTLWLGRCPVPSWSGGPHS